MSKRDEFIAIVNAFKAASPAITDAQRKGLLRQARQQYGLSFEEARHILKESGLVVGDVVNYFEVLGLSIDELQNETESAIATRVDAAHKELYGASLSAGGLPRPDGKTQEQWRTLLNQARDILKDPQQRREHLATLQLDGEGPDTPSRETTRPIFKFTNGDEATNISELAALMEKHPQEAAIALYRGYLEQSLGGAGEMHLAEAARTVASVYAKTPELGLWAMVQILRGKVKFARGGEASTPQQLAQLIDQNWAEAKTLLYGGFLPLWLEYTKQSQLANAAVDIIKRFGDETDLGLERLVQKLHPQIGHPVPKVSHTSINFGKVDRKSQKTVRVEIQNAGRGYLYGSVELARAMRGLRLSSTTIRGKAVLTVTLDASRLAVNQTHNIALVIKTNGSELRVPISCVPVDVGATSTSSSQDPETPMPKKESTDKAREKGWEWPDARSLGVLIFLLGILATIAPRIMDAPQQARVSKARREIGTLKTALGLYAVDIGDYPTTEQGLDALWRAPSPTPPNWEGPYTGTQNFIDPWNNPYVYRSPGTRPGYNYELYSLGKDGKIGGEGFDADITNWETGTPRESPLPSGDSRQGSVQNTTPTSPRASVPAGLVLIPDGEFQMGSFYGGRDDEKPVHTVYVDAFYMDKYEVTNAQFKAFVDANPQWRKDRIPRAYHDGYYLNHWTGNRYPNGKSNHPVVYVSWYSAMAYTQWAGKRLPTEAEWEKAARGGLVGQEYPWGNSIDASRANYAQGNTTPVDSYAANGYGLYDMAGNVWEWCLDGYDAGFYTRSPRRNPVSGAESPAHIVSSFTRVKTSRVLRGGSWLYSAQSLRVANRFRYTTTYTHHNIGFRCAMDVDP